MRKRKTKARRVAVKPIDLPMIRGHEEMILRLVMTSTLMRIPGLR